MNNKRGFVILVIIFVIMSAAALYVSYKVDSSDDFVCFGEECVEVEVARTAQELTHGLMYRESLEEGKGMLFVFEESGNYSFWMKNTLIPLDIIWINEDMQVIHIAEASPCEEEDCPTYSPNAMAKYVLEVNQGYAREHNVKIGDEVTLSLGSHQIVRRMDS